MHQASGWDLPTTLTPTWYSANPNRELTSVAKNFQIVPDHEAARFQALHFGAP